MPGDNDDVTIGVLPRLVTALDKAAKAGALPEAPADPPDRVRDPVDAGQDLRRLARAQAAYLAVAEHIAYVNPRVAAFSQYLLSDDSPRSSGYRYGGFESGLSSADGKEKPAYEGFRLPLAVERYGSSDVLWGLVRPERAVTQVTIEHKPQGATWRVLKKLNTTASGVYALKTRTAAATYRVQWTAPDGRTYTGPAGSGLRVSTRSGLNPARSDVLSMRKRWTRWSVLGQQVSDGTGVAGRQGRRHLSV